MPIPSSSSPRFRGVSVEFGEFRFEIRNANPFLIAHFRQAVQAIALLLQLPQLVMAHDHRVEHRVFLERELVLP